MISIAWFFVGLSLFCSGFALGPLRRDTEPRSVVYWLSILLAIGGWALMATMFGVWVS